MSIQTDYLSRVYAGWYGKLIGIRHGSNIEGWTYEQIAQKYGEIKGYIFDFKNFAADDDSNGPIFFIRALEDYSCSDDITSEQMGNTLLNYVPCEHGFFWWGGYGISTEHTAYINLMNGIISPKSGSAALNGYTVAEQIGGQIFIDTWGLVNPCNYQRAARFARKMASVTHDGNGVFGGMFIAACVSAAFDAKSIQEILNKGLSVIPADCEYARVVNAVIAFHRLHPDNWRECYMFVKENYGYDRYSGNCHIIPNAGIVVLALLYGNGCFSDSINICNMCGWDTDCNTANVGCIMGVFVGLNGIDPAWTKPITDFLACSSVLGCLNIRDIANDALYLAKLGYKLSQETPPEEIASYIEGTAPKYSFVLPRSTHTFRSDNDHVTFDNKACADTASKRALYIGLPARKNPLSIYRQTYYQPEDFNDNRYSPAFTPEIYPGQCFTMRISAKRKVIIRPYVFDVYSRKRIYGKEAVIDQWIIVKMHIPSGDFCIGQVGIEIAPEEENEIICDYITYDGKPEYTLDFQKAGWEYWNAFHTELSQTTNTKGIWEYRNGNAYGSCADAGELLTGDIHWDDYRVIVKLVPKFGRTHLVGIRIQGAMRGYWAGLMNDEIVILKKNKELIKLAAVPFNWKNNEPFVFEFSAYGNKMTLCINESSFLCCTDDHQPYFSGCCGISVREGSRCMMKSISVAR